MLFKLFISIIYTHILHYSYKIQDVLENEDVKLDNMFIASLVADIIRGMIYLHESPLRYHGTLCTSNCLIDSRWVVKLSDFGLHAFKKGLEDTPDVQAMASKCQSKAYTFFYSQLILYIMSYLNNTRTFIDITYPII